MPGGGVEDVDRAAAGAARCDALEKKGSGGDGYGSCPVLADDETIQGGLDRLRQRLEAHRKSQATTLHD